jgi:hypothetical protein
VAQRYGRALNLTLKDIQEAVQIVLQGGRGDGLAGGVEEDELEETAGAAEKAMAKTQPMPLDAAAQDEETLTGDER